MEREDPGQIKFVILNDSVSGQRRPWSDTDYNFQYFCQQIEKAMIRYSLQFSMILLADRGDPGQVSTTISNDSVSG